MSVGLRCAPLPEDALTSARTLSAFIDMETTKQPPRTASDRQKEFIKTLVEKEHIDPPAGGLATLSMKEASLFIDAHIHKTEGAKVETAAA